MIWTQFFLHLTDITVYIITKNIKWLEMTRNDMDYISELQKKADLCEFRDQREQFICDVIIFGVNDTNCT